VTGTFWSSFCGPRESELFLRRWTGRCAAISLLKLRYNFCPIASDDFDVDDAMRKSYRDAILKADSERQQHPQGSYSYRALSTAIERLQERLTHQQYKEPRWTSARSIPRPKLDDALNDRHSAPSSASAQVRNNPQAQHSTGIPYAGSPLPLASRHAFGIARAQIDRARVRHLERHRRGV